MAWSDIFIPSGKITNSEQQANQDRLNAEFQRRLDSRNAAGTLTPGQDAFYTSNTGGPLYDQNAAATEGFISGLSDAPKNVNSFFGGLIGNIFSAVPASVWLLAAVGLFFWMGGAQMLKGSLARRP